MKYFNLLTLILFSSIIGFSQINDSSIFIHIIQPSFSVQYPLGDIADRFGVNANIGVSYSIKTKSNFTLGVDAYYLFGNDIKENGILDSLRTFNGEITNKSGEYASILLSERGFYFGATIGKIIPKIGSVFLARTPNSGLILNFGAGLLQHKIKIENDGNNVPLIIDDYKKGYDRLTNGLAIKTFIGYMYLSKNRLINFYGGIEFMHAWTKSRRDWDYDLRKQDTKERVDQLISIKLGWVLPIYTRMPNKFYVY